MPFQSEKQKRFMFAKHPDIAKRWSKEYGSEPSHSASRLKDAKSGKSPNSLEGLKHAGRKTPS